LGWRHRIGPVAPMARRISMGARREVVWAVAERYAAAGRREKGRILDELTAVTGWHRKHAVGALRAKPPTQSAETVPRKRRYNAASGERAQCRNELGKSSEPFGLRAATTSSSAVASGVGQNNAPIATTRRAKGQLRPSKRAAP